MTVFCCLPFGIPAVVFAAQVNGKIASGDVAGALDYSRKAKLWCWLGVGLGLPIQVGIWILYMAGVLASSLK